MRLKRLAIYLEHELRYFALKNPQGRSMNALWKTTPEAYLGVVATGFPNLFLIGGPNSATGHTSFIYTLESHINYIVRCIARGLASNYLSIEVREQVQANYNARMQ